MFNDDDDDDEYGDEEDAVSGSLRWIRHSREDSASTVKSELEFARSPVRGEFEIAPQRPSPMNGASRFTPAPPCLLMRPSLAVLRAKARKCFYSHTDSIFLL